MFTNHPRLRHFTVIAIAVALAVTVGCFGLSL